MLYRSAYFNEWMRPQRFKYTLGNTLLADDGIVANITLLRPRPTWPPSTIGRSRASSASAAI